MSQGIFTEDKKKELKTKPKHDNIHIKDKHAYYLIT